jgi:hypothetical protein
MLCDVVTAGAVADTGTCRQHALLSWCQPSGVIGEVSTHPGGPGCPEAGWWSAPAGIRPAPDRDPGMLAVHFRACICSEAGLMTLCVRCTGPQCSV